MPVVVVTRPEALLTPGEAKTLAPVLRADDDFRINGLLAAAQGTIEPPVSRIGRAFGEQVLELVLDSFGCWPIRLPWPPLIEVLSVKYVDAAGVEQTLAPTSYEVCGASSAQPQLRPATGFVWPATKPGADRLRVRYRAGYAVGAPELLIAKQAVVLVATHLRSLSTADLALRSETVDGVGSQQWTVSEVAQTLINSAVEDLLAPLQVYT